MARKIISGSKAIQIGVWGLLFLGALAAARAMSVLPPTFPELVDESARIVRARVIAVEPIHATAPDGRSYIKTRVTWQVDRTLKGMAAGTLTLEFLGGTIGGESLRVPGMPQFAVGNEDYLFIEPNEKSICPLLAAGHGRYPIKSDAATGRSYVMRSNGVPLTGVAQVAEPIEALSAAPATRGTPGAAYAPDAFEAEILTTLAKIQEARHAQP